MPSVIIVLTEGEHLARFATLELYPRVRQRLACIAIVISIPSDPLRSRQRGTLPDHFGRDVDRLAQLGRPHKAFWVPSATLTSVGQE